MPTEQAFDLEITSIRSRAGELVRDVRLSASRGACLAIVGESGSGKSLAARAGLGLLPGGLSAAGRLRLGDRSIALGTDDSGAADRAWRAVRGSVVTLLLQDPFTSLSPVRRIGTQLADTLRAHPAALEAIRGRGRLRSGIADAVIARLDEVNLPARVARQYPHELSGGMLQRAALAAALAADPRVLIADEPTTALDASTQAEVLALIDRLRLERGMAVLLISHDLQLVRTHADEVAVMFAGSVVERGSTARVIDDPRHPYTAGLLAAAPSLTHRAAELPQLPWRTPHRGGAPDGTTFGDGYPGAENARVFPAPRLIPLDGREVAVYPTEAPRPPAMADAPETGGIARASAAEAGIRPDRHPGEPLLRVSGLGVRLGGRPVLSGIDFAVPRGQLLGIVGESGSGKTTLARAIVGLTPSTDGRIELALRNGTRTVHRPHRSVQIVFQDPAAALNPARTVGAALREVLRIAGDRTTGGAELLARVGLPPALLERRPRDLSGGQRQRVAIARALALRPELLICDESVSALDVSVQAQILRLLAELRRTSDLTILFISHDLGVINQIADRIVVLKDGAVVEDGAADQVLLAPAHPYTAQLIAAARSDRAAALDGSDTPGIAPAD